MYPSAHQSDTNPTPIAHQSDTNRSPYNLDIDLDTGIDTSKSQASAPPAVAVVADNARAREGNGGDDDRPDFNTVETI